MRSNFIKRLIIAQAAAELETQNSVDFQKQAEDQGAAAFDALYKQAQLEAIAQENETLKQKLAHYEQIEKEAAQKEAERKEEEKMAKIASLAAEIIRRELSAAPAPTK